MNTFRLSMIVVAVVTTGCETLGEIDRGLYSTANSVSQRDQITGTRALSFKDRAKQIERGNNAAEQLIAQERARGKRVNGEYDQSAYERVQRIFNRLQQVSHVRNETWTPILLEDNENWNAFTTGGTYFVVHSKLVEDLRDDSELANVIAHEIGHSVANHIFEREAYGVVNTLAASRSIKEQSFQASFTLKNEFEADRIAILYCALAGFNPHAGERVWNRMLRTEGNRAQSITDHPINSERATEAQRIANLADKYYLADKKNNDFEKVLSRNDIFSYLGEPIAAGKGGGFLALLEIAADTIGQQKRAKFEQQRQHQRVEFMAAVNRLTSVKSSMAIGATRWRVGLQYRGDRALTDLIFKVVVMRRNNTPLTITRQFGGFIRPDSSFTLDFDSPELDAYNLNPKNVHIQFDNARGM